MKVEIEDIVLAKDGGLYACYTTEGFRPAIVYASQPTDVLASIKSHLDDRLATRKAVERLTVLQEALLLRGKAFTIPTTVSEDEQAPSLS